MEEILQKGLGEPVRGNFVRRRIVTKTDIKMDEYTK